MATVPSASPRPSLSQLRSPASSRTSLDTVSTVTRGDTAPAPRRNRAALRDYYRLKSPTQADSGSGQAAKTKNDAASLAPPTRLDPLDKDGFDAGSYVRQLLEIENLEGLLGVENELVGEVRTLDGERKALVYDNYSKLIAATETIIKMRSNMDPLAPATITLAPAIAHIAETAVGLASEMEADESAKLREAQRSRKDQIQLVQRALKGPDTLRKLLDEDREDEAKSEWTIIQSILDRCDGAKDAAEIREKCQRAMSSTEPNSDEE